MPPLPDRPPTIGMGSWQGSQFLGENRDEGAVSDALLTRTAFARPVLRYQGTAGEWEMQVEVYKIGGLLSVNLYCPRCKKSLWIKSPQKKIDYDPKQGLSVEPFRCTWELENDRFQSQLAPGVNLCKLTLAIENNRVFDA